MRVFDHGVVYERPRDLRRVPPLLPHRRHRLAPARRQRAARGRARRTSPPRSEPAWRATRSSIWRANVVRHDRGRRDVAARQRRRRVRVETPALSSPALVSNAGGPSRAVLATPSEVALRLATAPRPAEAARAGRRHQRPPRDYFLRRALATADCSRSSVAGAVALLVVPDDTSRLSLALAAPTLPVWLVLFRRLRALRARRQARQPSALDDLPALFHAFVLGSLLLWVYLKLLPVTSSTSPTAARLRRLGDRDRVRAALRPGAPCSRARRPERVLLVGRVSDRPALVRKMVGMHPEYGLEPVGVVSGDADGDLPSLPDLGRSGGPRSARPPVAQGVERVIVDRARTCPTRR